MSTAREFVQEFIDSRDCGEMSYSDIARAILEETEAAFAFVSLRRAASQLDGNSHASKAETKKRPRGAGETLSAGSEGDWFRMDDDDGIYVFRIDGTMFQMTYREIEEMVAVYVHEGGGLSQVQVARHMWERYQRKLTADFVRKIFKVLGVVKHNPPLAPHIVRHTDPEDASDLWHEQKLAEIETRYRAKRHKKLEKALKEEREKSLHFEDLAAEYLDNQDRKIVHVPTAVWDCDIDTYGQTAIVCLSDWHVGKISENAENEADYRAQIDRLVHRLRDYFEIENRRPVERLIFAVVGDMLDGTQGDMHEGQFFGQWCHGRTQGDIAAETLALVIEGLSQRLGVTGEVHCVTGNHDRTSRSRDGDPLRTVGGMVYLLAQERSPSCNWNIIDEPFGCFSAGGTGFLLSHGDLTPKDPRKLFHGLGGEYQAVITGHFHSHGFAEDYRGSWFQVGSLCGVDRYARGKGFGAGPSQLVISAVDGLPPVSRYIPVV